MSSLKHIKREKRKKMKVFLMFASIPLALFIMFFGLPHLFAGLINSHTDAGLIAMVMLACGIVGFVASKVYNLVNKETKNENS